MITDNLTKNYNFNIFNIDLFINTKILQPITQPNTQQPNTQQPNKSLTSQTIITLPSSTSIILNYINQNNTSKPITLSLKNVNSNDISIYKSIYIVCGPNLNTDPYCLLDIGCIWISSTFLSINNIKYLYPAIKLNTYTIVSCIINETSVLISCDYFNNQPTIIILNDILDNRCKLPSKCTNTVSIGQCIITQDMQSNFPFLGIIKQVVIYNTVVNSNIHKQIINSLKSNNYNKP